MEPDYAVHEDIARARTLDRAFYRDPAAWDAVRERVFARTWQWLGGLADVAPPGSLAPRDLLPGLVPLLLCKALASMVWFMQRRQWKLVQSRFYMSLWLIWFCPSYQYL